MAAINDSSGITPASVSGVARTMIMNRMAVSPVR
jgi:hypothetical protein